MNLFKNVIILEAILSHDLKASDRNSEKSLLPSMSLRVYMLSPISPPYENLATDFITC